MTHWTERGTEDFLFSIAAGFLDQAETKLQAGSWTETAERIGVSERRLHQILNNPDKLTLKTAIKLARS